MVRIIQRSSSRLNTLPRGLQQTQTSTPRGLLAKETRVVPLPPRGQWKGIIEEEQQVQAEYDKQLAEYNELIRPRRRNEYQTIESLTTHDRYSNKYIPLNPNHIVEYYSDGKVKSISLPPVQFYGKKTYSGLYNPATYIPQKYEFDNKGRLTKYIEEGTYNPKDVKRDDKKDREKEYKKYIRKEIIFRPNGTAINVTENTPVENYKGWSGDDDRDYTIIEELQPTYIGKYNEYGQQTYKLKEKYDDIRDNPDERLAESEEIDYLTGKYFYKDYEAQREQRKILEENERIRAAIPPEMIATTKKWISSDINRPYYNQPVVQTQSGKIRPVSEINREFDEMMVRLNKTSQQTSQQTSTTIPVFNMPQMQMPKMKSQITPLKQNVGMPETIRMPSSVSNTPSTDNLFRGLKSPLLPEIKLSNMIPKLNMPEINFSSNIFKTKNTLSNNVLTKGFKVFEQKVSDYLGKKI